MLERAKYATRPDSIDYRVIPGKNYAEVWLRANIEEVQEDMPESQQVITYWEADEAFFHTDATREEIEEDFEGFFDEASGWMPEVFVPVDIDQLRADVDYLLMKEG